MFCKECGTEIAPGSAFCGKCGSPAPSQSAGPAPTSPVPPKKRRTGLWIGIASAAAVVVALAVALPLTLLDRSDEAAEIAEISTNSTAANGSTTTRSTARPVTTTTVPSGPPGDSAGAWVEAPVSGLPENVTNVALSEEAMLIMFEENGRTRLGAFVFGSGDFVDLPAEDVDPYMAIEGLTAVWGESVKDEATGKMAGHVYSYHLTGGTKNEIGGGGEVVGFPRIAHPWVSWMEAVPWEEDAEYWDLSIHVRRIDSTGAPEGESAVVAPSVIATESGDARWAYSLSKDHLAWEQHMAVDDPGTGAYKMGGVYVKNISSPAGPAAVPLGEGTWSPSIAGDTMVFWRDGIRVLPLAEATGPGAAGTIIDDAGLLPSATPTYVAYFRPLTAAGDPAMMQVVVRGLSGDHEQVLSEHSGSLWSAANVATSSTRIAFALEGTVRLFEWKSGPVTGTSVARTTTTSTTEEPTTTTALPTGPALVVASLPSPIPRVAWGTDGSRWDYTVTFKEAKGVAATIEWIGIRYVDTNDVVWVVDNREWFAKTIEIEAGGSAKYSTWVRTKDGGKGDLRGGMVKFSFTGHDASGNKFRGEVTATLAKS